MSDNTSAEAPKANAFMNAPESKKLLTVIGV